MKIHIKSGAAQAYRNDRFVGDIPVQFSYVWITFLKTIEDTWLTVEPKHLFENQFNTAPLSSDAQKQAIERIDGVSESQYEQVLDLIQSTNGHRIMSYCVDEIIDDQRVNAQRCQWCGYSHTPVWDDVCHNCRRDDHLKPFFRIVLVGQVANQSR
jgi:hypothetical protein